MKDEGLDANEIERVSAEVGRHPMTLAIIRSEHAPSELTPLLRTLAKACRMSLRRVLSSPTSEFGIAELNSKDKMLIVLFMGGRRTELVSVSRTDDISLRDLEDSIHFSNFHSELVRIGL